MATTAKSEVVIRPLNKLYLDLKKGLTKDDEKTMKQLLLKEQIDQNTIEKLTSATDVFYHLEDRGFIGENNLDLLKELFKAMSKSNLEKIVRDFCENRRKERETKTGDGTSQRGDPDDETACGTGKKGLKLNGMAALVVATEWLPRHGDLQVTLVQRENACILRKHGLDVYYMVLKATQEDKTDAEKHGITLITPKEIDLPVNEDPSINWLMLHKATYPHISTLDIGVIIGHVTADPNHTTANAAKSIQREIFEVAKFVPVFHTIPSDVISNAETAHKLERNMVELSEGAHLVVSVGPKVWKFFSDKVSNRDLHMCYLPFVDETICNIHFEERIIRNNVELFSHVRESLTKCCDEYKAVAGAVGRVSTSFYDTMDLTSKWKFAAGDPVNEFEEFRINFHKLANNAQSLEINKVHTESMSDFSNLMQQSHIFIHGPNTDPVGITPLMACTAGIPSVITSNCGFAEFLQEHFPSLAKHVIVQVGLHQLDADTEEWRKAVLSIIKNYSHRQEVAQALKKCLIESAKNGNISECHKIFAAHCSTACDALLQEWDKDDSDAGKHPKDTSLPNVSPRKRKLDDSDAGKHPKDTSLPNVSPRKRKLGEIEIHISPSKEEGSTTVTRQISITVKSKDDLPATCAYTEQIGATIIHISYGSLLVVFECKTIETVETLERDERDGKLRKIFEKDIVTKDVLKRCNATSMSLKTTVETWQYHKCALEIKYYKKGAVSDSVANAERKIQQEKIEVNTSAVVPKARSEEEIVQTDDIESSQGPDISEEHVYDHSIGDTSKVVKDRTSQGKHLASDQTQGTALLAMEIEPKAYLGDVHRGVLSKFVGDFTQIPMETSEKSAGNALVLLKKAHRNMPTLRLEILHLLGIRKIFGDISLESCVQTDEVGRECFSPSKLLRLLGTDIEDLFMKQIGTIGKGSLLAQALTPLKTITVDKNHLCLSNYLQQEYEDCQLAKMDSNVSKHLKNQMELQKANVEQEKNKLEEKLRLWTPVWKKKNDTISELQKTVEEKNKEISHIVEILKQTTMNLRAQLSLKEVTHAKMMQDVLVDLDELIQWHSESRSEESAMVNTQMAESTEVVTEVGYIAGMTDGKNGKAMESPLASKLTSSDPQFTGPKDTKDIFSRDTATNEAINQKDGVKSISEVSVVSRDTEDSHKISIKKKKKKTFSGQISSAFQKLVSKLTSPGKKGDINAVDKDGNTYLHIAAGSGDIDKVNAAIKAGADLERKDEDGDTAIISAALEGYVDIVKCLIEAGANVNASGGDGFTPLHCAAQNGHKDVAEILIGAKANIEAVTKTKDTPLTWAAYHGHPDVVRILIDAGANKEACDESNSMPVHLAALKGHLDIVKYFIKTLGIDKEVKGQDNKTPVINAAEGGHSEVVKYLLGIGADIEAVTSYKSTPLIWAAKKGHADVVRILIDAGANTEARNQKGKTALRLALDNGHTDVAKLLTDASTTVK